MTLSARIRHSSDGQVAITILAVLAIITGLLSMHVLTSAGPTDSATHIATMGNHGDGMPMADVSTGTTSSPITTTSVALESTNGVGGSGHSMLGMMCVLGLLITMVFLSLHLARIRWVVVRMALRTLTVCAATLAQPTTPSLHVLSISRT